jgi:methylase of polypeptide subunit release factors
LLEQAAAMAQRPQWLLLELGEGQAQRAIEMARRIMPEATAASYRDLRGTERGLILSHPEEPAVLRRTAGQASERRRS